MILIESDQIVVVLMGTAFDIYSEDTSETKHDLIVHIRTIIELYGLDLHLKYDRRVCDLRHDDGLVDFDRLHE